MLKLYNYFRSSCSYRVRIALNWKGLKFEYLPIHLVKDGGHQNHAEFRRINPMGHVPALDHDGFLVTESLAIVQYLDDIAPAKRLVPTTPREKARVLELCEIINSGIQPMQNLKLTKFLESEFDLERAECTVFVQHWIEDGFANLERMLAKTAGTYCVGDQFSAVDAFLVPQCLTTIRFGIALEKFPHIARLNENALKLESVLRAHPSQQPDFEP